MSMCTIWPPASSRCTSACAAEAFTSARSDGRFSRYGATFIVITLLLRLLLFVALVLPLAAAAQRAARASDQVLRWSDAATWGGEVPGAGAEVVVPAGATVLLDTDSAALGNLAVEGTLRFAAADVELKAAAIQVSGALQIGSAAEPHRHRATITLTGAPLARGNDGIARGLNVQGGTLELHGAVPKPVWTRLGEHASAGTTQPRAGRGATDWRAGDTIAVGPSDFYGVAATERLVLAADASGARLATQQRARRSALGPPAIRHAQRHEPHARARLHAAGGSRADRARRTRAGGQPDAATSSSRAPTTAIGAAASARM